MSIGELPTTIIIGFTFGKCLKNENQQRKERISNGLCDGMTMPKLNF